MSETMTTPQTESDLRAQAAITTESQFRIDELMDWKVKAEAALAKAGIMV